MHIDIAVTTPNLNSGWKGVTLLAAQHCSSSFGDRLAEFAWPLYLIELFSNTLLPASIFGFVITGAGIVFSGSIGSLVDKYPRIRTVRTAIVAQKISAAIGYALFLVLFLRYKSDATDGTSQTPEIGKVQVWALFSGVSFAGCLLKLATVGMNVSIERDWVMCIAGDDSERLTRLNAIMRRVDLMCKLIAPLFVSLLTTAASYPFSIMFLLGLSVVTAFFEFVFIQVVYQHFPALAHKHSETLDTDPTTDTGMQHPVSRKLTLRDSISRWLEVQVQDWKTFISYPVFYSSVAIALLYLTVLSFDSTFLSYLKSATDYSDPFIAGIRAICVVTGLGGTFVMPMMERKIGLVRTGTWSIVYELITLIPCVIALYIGSPSTSDHRAPWNTAMLFTGMALSRTGLWAFDLVQLTQLQTGLSAHPRRNALTGLQFSLQNIFDLAHYGLTIGWSQPSQFKYAAAVSWGSVFLATVVYVFGYARRVRGHVFHFDFVLLSRKSD